MKREGLDARERARERGVYSGAREGKEGKGVRMGGRLSSGGREGASHVSPGRVGRDAGHPRREGRRSDGVEPRVNTSLGFGVVPELLSC